MCAGAKSAKSGKEKRKEEERVQRGKGRSGGGCGGKGCATLLQAEQRATAKNTRAATNKRSEATAAAVAVAAEAELVQQDSKAAKCTVPGNTYA